MYVTLSHSPNPDIRSGYWETPEDEHNAVKREVHSFKEASHVCRQYIERNRLGGGNWNGGAIFDEGKQVAYVSYNGRVWRGTHYVTDAEEIKI